MATIATGQITIVDYNDAVSLTGFIGSNYVKTQTVSPDNGSCTPNWTSAAPLVLTASLYKLGTTNDIIDNAEIESIKWFKVVSGTETQITTTSGTYIVSSATKSKTLKISNNVLVTENIPAIDIVCEVTYVDPRDPSGSLKVKHKMDITFSKLTSGGGIVTALAQAPEGNVFKNNTVASLPVECYLYRGSTKDTTNVSYQWYERDSSIKTDQGGGIGWRKLDSATAEGCTGYTTAVLTVPAGAVESYSVFKCIIKDTDAASGTYNQKFEDVISLIDNSDPIQISVLSSGGDVFKNGQGNSTLTARLFRAGEEIDTAGTAYVYTWTKYNNAGQLVSSFTKTGKSVEVTSDDVDIKATFVVELREK